MIKKYIEDYKYLQNLGRLVGLKRKYWGLETNKNFRLRIREKMDIRIYELPYGAWLKLINQKAI